MSYGYVDSAAVTNSSSSNGKFGLNQGALVTKFEYNPNGGQDGSAGDCIDLTISINDAEYRRRYFPVTKAYGENNEEVTDPKAPEFVKEVNFLNATLMDICKVFVTEDEIKTALSNPAIKDFVSFAQALERLVKSKPNWDKEPVDVFLQYQWSIKGDKEVTYLELPKTNSIKHGSWIVAHINADFKQSTTDKGISYLTSEGIKHPFKRSEWFATSNFGVRQDIRPGSDSATTANTTTTGTTGGW